MTEAGRRAAVRVEDLTVSLGGREVLDRVSFEVGAGRFCAVLGPNGSGKTTLIRSLYRSLEPSAGRVALDGRDLAQMKRRAVGRKIAVLRQEDDLAFDFSVRELVLMGRSPYKGLLAADDPADHEAVAGVLEDCDVSALASRSFQTLSGGEKQRVLLARALVQAPSLLLLDEPTNHLDLFHQLDIFDRVRKLGCTVIAALHQLELAHRFADDVLVLEAGRKVAFGPPDEALRPELIREVFSVRAVRIEGEGTAAWSFSLPGDP